MNERLTILDLDGTCYPRDCELTRIIDARTTEFLLRRTGLAPAELARMEERTPSILEALDQLDIPRRQWADAVYRAVPYQQLLQPDPELTHALSCMAAKRVVVTMAPQQHAVTVLEALGLTTTIDHTISVFETNYTDKQDIYRALIEKGSPSQTTVFGDNVALDLDPAAALGCGCVHIAPQRRAGPYPVYQDLLQALSARS
ncbi:HAD family hydrolase [Nocardia asteroides]|uniref:HAD family hydrolase n=1 Tax=Nocardia asteroides TaxID=1824 RepID=UPI0036490ED7